MAHGFIAWIIIGLIAGFITGKIMKGSGFGALMDIIVGIVGAIIDVTHFRFGGIGWLNLFHHCCCNRRSVAHLSFAAHHG